MKLRLPLLLLCLAFAVPQATAVGPARQDPIISMSLTAGYSGYYRQGQWVPLRVTVQNSGADFEGAIRVRTGSNPGLEDTTFRTPLDLPQGARKLVYLYASLDDFAGRVQVEVVDTGGRVIEREGAAVRMVSPGDILSVVVTEAPRGAIDLGALSSGTGESIQTQWQPDQIPPRAEALAGVDVMLFHDVDTGLLSTEQLEAIERWVLTGGYLIVSGGETWQRTTVAFQDLLPVNLRGSVTVDSLEALATYARQPGDALRTSATATDSTARGLSRVLVETGGVPLLTRRDHGAGVVDFLAVDPGAEPMRSWSEGAGLWYALAVSLAPEPSWAEGFANWTGARAATETTLGSALPSFIQLCGFLLLYIVLLGPLNYLVLKRLNRREWAWISVPALVLLFSALAYLVGFNLRGSEPVVNRLAVVRVWPGAEQAQVQALIGVQSPRRRMYDITVERGYSLRPLPGQGLGLNVPAVINEGTRYVAEGIPIDAGTIASLVAAGYASAPSLDSTVTWHLEQGQPLRIAGRVTNTAGVTLQDAVLVVKGGAVALGTLAPTQSETFDLALDPQDPGPLTLGNPYGQFRPYGASRPWGLNQGGPAWCYSYAGIYLTVKDVMSGTPFSCANNAGDAAQEIRRRYRLLSALVVDAEASGGRGSGAYLFAWSDQPLVEVELAGQPFAAEDTTLFLFELPVAVSPANESVEVPPGLTTWTHAATDDPTTLLDVSPLDFGVDDGEQAVFQFAPLPDMSLAEVSALEIFFQAQGSFSVELWDWQAQAWEAAPLDALQGSTLLSERASPGTRRVRDLSRFIGPQQAVRLRVMNLDPIVYNRIDHLKIGYIGRLAFALGEGPTAMRAADRG